MALNGNDEAQLIAVTMGEPAGIGPEILLKLWINRTRKTPAFLAIADPDWLRSVAETSALNVPIAEISSPAEAMQLFATALPVLPVTLAHSVKFGELDVANAPTVTNAIEQAAKFALAGAVDAIVTNPIHKLTLYQAGFSYPGHTEFLGALADHPDEPVMMLASNRLRVVPVTKHVSLAEAISTLTPELIIKTVTTTAKALGRDFGVVAPRLAISGLNPHAGEGGSLGREEIEIIGPAVAALDKLGIDITGPVSADTMFHQDARRSYDAAICMFHDQALIPIKTLDFESAVNVTLGLPFIRTSPDHGTALDIAGNGTASEESLAAALEMAALMARHRNAATVSA